MTGLSLSNLSLHYGKQPVLDGIDVSDLPRGAVIGLLGANGVGKSTLLRAIAGLGDYEGQVSFDGMDLSALTRFDRSGKIGYLPQVLPQKTSLMAWEAVVSAGRAVRPDLSLAQVECMAEAILQRLHITGLAFRPLNRLSGGQRQMVGLAQVLVKNPDLLLLDEPTSALDLRWQLSVFDVVRAMVQDQGSTCLVAIHDINLALRHCDQIIVLADGGILSHGPPGQAMSSRILEQAYRIKGRVETCSQGHAFIVTDKALPISAIR